MTPAKISDLTCIDCNWLSLSHVPTPQPNAIAKERQVSHWLGRSHVPTPGPCGQSERRAGSKRKAGIDVRGVGRNDK